MDTSHAVRDVKESEIASLCDEMSMDGWEAVAMTKERMTLITVSDSEFDMSDATYKILFRKIVT
jgi:hypothetical protein